MAKHEKVPETRSIKPNREQRRHPEKLERPENEPLSRDDGLQDQGVKDSPPRKHTAEKWNQ